MTAVYSSYAVAHADMYQNSVSSPSAPVDQIAQEILLHPHNPLPDSVVVPLFEPTEPLLQMQRAKALTDLTFEEIEDLDLYSQISLQPEQIHVLKQEQIQALTTEQLGGLSPIQISVFTREQLGALSTDQIGVLRDDQIAAFSAIQLAVLTPHLTDEQLSSLPLKQLPQLPSGCLAKLMTRLSDKQVQQHTHNQIRHLFDPIDSPEDFLYLLFPNQTVQFEQLQHLKKIIDADLNQLKTNFPNNDVEEWLQHFPAVDPETQQTLLKRISQLQVNLTTYNALLELVENKEELEEYHELFEVVFSGIGTLTERQRQLVKEAIPQMIPPAPPLNRAVLLTKLQIKKLSNDEVRSFSQHEIASLKKGRLEIFARDHFAHLRLDQIGSLPEEGIPHIPPLTLVSLRPNQLKRLTPNQVRKLTPDQVDALSPTQVSLITPTQIQALQPQQLAGLNPRQIQALYPRSD
ncbi:MAG: hypothetical protein KDK65_07260 [Chlamydiia bacterium]|nr:hypothetical protein [Chlamydiia bacterium]